MDITPSPCSDSTPTGALPWVVAALVTISAACAAPGTSGPVSPPSDTIRVVDTVRVQGESSAVERLEAQVGRLQLQLLERDVRLEVVLGELDGTRQEVARNLAKPQSQATRAEAASVMAEAELAVQSLGRLPGGAALAEYGEARTRLDEGSAAFDEDNYGGALYLASQARAAAAAGQARLSPLGTGLRDDETMFAAPVPLRTTQRSNLRGGPGLDFGIDLTLDAGTALTGQSFTSEWVRVVDETGTEGWIFHTLVTARVP